MYTSQLLSFTFETRETEPLVNEFLGTRKENEIRGAVSVPETGTQVTILSFVLAGSVV